MVPKINISTIFFLKVLFSTLAKTKKVLPLIIIFGFNKLESITILKQPCTNFSERKDRKTKAIANPQFIILHYTAGCSTKSAWKRFLEYLNPVSAHYIIAPDGTITQTVEDNMQAWHAGKSQWGKQWQINAYSIGIEIVNPGYTEEKIDPCQNQDNAAWDAQTSIRVNGSPFSWYPFTTKQISSAIELCKLLIEKYNIPARHILGHSDIAPGRKLDPGPLFPWKALAEHGIGLWPSPIKETTTLTILQLQNELQKFGYKLYPSGRLDTETKQVIQAFQSHFRANNIDGQPDKQSMEILINLLSQIS